MIFFNDKGRSHHSSIPAIQIRARPTRCELVTSPLSYSAAGPYPLVPVLPFVYVLPLNFAEETLKCAEKSVFSFLIGFTVAASVGNTERELKLVISSI